ncbi:MAG: hypothetical protein ACP5UC_00705 [Candidatus Micrarchaeia archaeon]
MPSKKSEKAASSYAIRTASLLDLVRNALSRAGPSAYIFAVRQGDKYRLVLPGEKIGSLKIVYYFDTDKIAKFAIYSPFGESEKIEMKNSIDGEEHDYKSYKMQIMELLNNPFEGYFSAKSNASSKKAGGANPIIMKAKDYDSLVRQSLSFAAEDEKMGKIYYFESNGKGFLCSIEDFNDEEGTILYAEAENKNIFNFMRYNYISNRVESVNSLEGAAYTLLAVVRLAEPFPFFKPE